MHLITGGSASGKSEYAEAQALALKKRSPRSPMFYVATMWNDGAEAMERIERHRALRAGKGFITLECPVSMQEACDAVKDHPDSIVLLECLSNLAANVMFAPEAEALHARGSGREVWEDDCFDILTQEIDQLANSVGHLIIVSNEIYSDGVDYDEMTTSYIRLMGRLHQYFAKESSRVTEVVYGCAIRHKEELCK